MKPEYFGVVASLCNGEVARQSEELVKVLETAFHEGKMIFIFGNGGSGATASHFCEDLGKGTLKSCDDGKRFKAISLTDNASYILAWANDEGYDTIFEQQLRNLAEPGDVAIGISGSGNSKNVLKAITYANETGLVTVGLTGFDGGELRRLVHHCVHIPVHDMGIAECLHLIVAHYVVDTLRRRIHQRGEKEIGVTIVGEKEIFKEVEVVKISA